MEIRREQPSDYEALCHLVREAFATAHYSDGTEVAWLDEVRESERYLPELSFVAEDDGCLIGHLLTGKCTYETIDGPRIGVVIAPLCIHPDKQGKGLGGKLVRHMLAEAAARGYQVAFLEGFLAYYERLGFQPASDYGLCAYDPTPGGNALLLRGTGEELPKNLIPGVVDLYGEAPKDPTFRQ